MNMVWHVPLSLFNSMVSRQLKIDCKKLKQKKKKDFYIQIALNESIQIEK